MESLWSAVIIQAYRDYHGSDQTDRRRARQFFNPSNKTSTLDMACTAIGYPMQQILTTLDSLPKPIKHLRRSTRATVLESRKVGVCVECWERKTIHARGLCDACYWRERNTTGNGGTKKSNACNKPCLEEVDCGVRAETTRLKRHSQGEPAPAGVATGPLPD